MNIFLDCEFDGFDGPLLSIGLIDSDGRGFYAVLTNNVENAQNQWVKDNVIPLIAEANTHVHYLDEYQLFRHLSSFLSVYSKITIIADWPADLGYFFKYLTNKGMAPSIAPVRSLLLPVLDANDSIVRHNAYEDAVALRSSFEKTFGSAYTQL